MAQMTSSLVSVGYVSWNVASSVGLILINKWLLDFIRLECILFLTGMHLIASWIAVYALIKLGYESYKPMPGLQIARVVASFFFTVAFFNLSLKLNSVGTYQLSKLLVTPVTAAMQYVFFRKSVGLDTQAALGVICVCVAFVTTADVTVTMTGVGCSCVAILASATHSLWSKSKPTELGLTTYQLNFHMFPWTAMCFIAASMLVERDPVGQMLGLLQADLDPEVAGSSRVAFMVLTCLMAASLNISSSQLIFYTSPLTYHVVGHFKLILILIFGVLFLNSPVSGTLATGMLGAVGGVVWYTSIKYREQQAAAKVVQSDKRQGA
ncbi:solute carrier family 35 [Thecamonas trahens ATCC 50062]|uniref:Solute carrier family 35 n=1 Tax=Thecamonas trahens ATCC 50062 TaxID=461836 RepID=A0A0L0DNN1_THETB|nr:solute carrier family 35 [Thecamonas trahens ATCC 50062]KNC53927.1 solute carrier family 35 [Thecamonas trahens ATCC 50062]|eukprot:XP_013754131.1 solute carrier family 35 [Thecamonas trahens ATCC 50062]